MGLTLSIIREAFGDKGLSSITTLSPAHRTLLDEEADGYTALIVASLPPGVILGKQQPVEGSILKTEEVDLGWKKTGSGFADWEQDPTSEEFIRLTRELTIPLLSEDDFLGEEDTKMFELLRSRPLLPLRDKMYTLSSDEEAEKLLDELRLLPKEDQANPIPYHTWTEMSSDEAMSRIFFYGIGSVLMHSQSANENKHKNLGPFVVDMDLSGFEVRSGYATYGSRLHFDANQKITAIYDYGTNKLVKPGDGDAWEQAKHIAKQTTFTLITAREHLLWTHMLLSNSMTRIKSEELPPNHPIRRLLTVFSFRTNLVNNQAKETLVPKMSMVHRATAFTFDSIVNLFVAGYQASNIFEPFPAQKISADLKKMSDAGNFPYHAEGAAWFEIVRSFVSEWFNKAGSYALEDKQASAFFKKLADTTKGQQYQLSLDTKDAKIDALAQMIFVVTAYHEIVGTVVDYTRLPSFMGFRATADTSTTSTDMQSFLIASALTSSTALRMPMLVGKFENFFGAGGAPSWEIDVWANFQNAIQKQSQKVRSADARRKIEFKSMDPALFECAVSV